MSEGLSPQLADLLATLPPGHELAEALAQVRRPELCVAEVALVSQARARQLAQLQGELLADILELGLCAWSADENAARLGDLDEFSADQIAFTLTLTRSNAEGQLILARDIVQRLPAVHTAMMAGRVDYLRAKIFADGLRAVPDPVARAIADRLLSRAPTWTSTQLRERLRYHVLKADPTLARRRYERGVSQRRLYLGPAGADDGTAALVGSGLPVHRAVEADAWLNQLAQCAKHAGDPRTVAQLRVDAALDLLSGRAFRTAPSLDALTAVADRPDPADQPETIPPRHPVFGSDDCPFPLPDNDPDIYVPESWVRGVTDAESFRADLLTGPPMATHASSTGGGPSGRPRAEPDDPTRRGPRGKRPEPGAARGVCDIMIPWSTLVGLTDNPGLIPGWGPVIADLARQIALDPTAPTRWIFNITDDGGRLLSQISTRRRPTNGTQRFVQARDRTCRAPGCRRKASYCDQDHRRDWAKGGTTESANLCVLCRHHHRLKHGRDLSYDIHPNGTVWWRAPDDRLFFTPNDGSIYFIEEGDDMPTPQPVNQIIPIRRKAQRRRTAVPAL